MDKLQRLEKINSGLEKILDLADQNLISPGEIEKFIVQILEAVATLKSNLESKIEDGDSELNSNIEGIRYSLGELELRTKDLINSSERSSLSNVKELSQRLVSEINRIERIIVNIPKNSELNEGIKDIKVEIDTTNSNILRDKEDLLKKISLLESEIKRIPGRSGGITIGGSRPISVFNNGTAVSGSVTEFNFVNPTSITTTGGAQRRVNITTGGGAGGGHTIEDEGTSLTQRTKLNFVGSGVTVTDDSGDDATVVTINGGGGGSGGLTKETPSGSVNGSNTSYTVTVAPEYVVADGATYFANNGYTISSLTITMTNAPSQYIRSFYVDAGASSMTFATPTGSVNSSNTSYTVSAEPIYVVADGTTYFAGAGYTYGALAITMDNAPSQYIRYTY